MNLLRKRKDDRGLMANLRCFLTESRKQRSWPALNRLGVDIKDEVTGLIAGLYATHPEECSTGNCGTTWRSIGQRYGATQGGDNKLTPTERRFQQLLAAEKGKELHGRIIRMVLMAKSQGVPVNYEQLEKDLRYWNDRTMIEWASAFWTPEVKSESNEEAP
ncbi:MAG: type I-E CRISPR-associated protein Cse2/CasB [Candidatus Aminicenantes bacterium]|nr:type I-E CRISPR-associated protein Cse2/CasB [Candidatus Aminicenantes bacterium]